MQLNQYRKRHQSVWAIGMLDRYNNKMVLMVDGVRFRHLYYGYFSLGDNFPLEKIEKVEVIMRPASSLYGPMLSPALSPSLLEIFLK
ncbi:MAG: outer membrane receptor for ferrienterochelin and colicins [Psychroserpens sp.]|jgi:outer membrane receptor for ferrienterochelin and colicin